MANIKKTNSKGSHAKKVSNSKGQAKRTVKGPTALANIPTATPKKLPAPLPIAKVFSPCPTNQLSFRSTAQIESSHDIISQKRAVSAIDMGLGIRKPGYNIYVAGMGGTGKTSVIRSFLEKWSVKSPPPSDYIYVYNFDVPDAPKCVELATGTAHKFSKRMDQAIKGLHEDIPNALQSEDYENAVNAYVSQNSDQKSRMFSELEKLAKSMDFQVKSTRMGIETIPVLDGRPLTEKEYGKLTEIERKKIEDTRSKLEPEVLDFARKVRAIETKSREYIEKLQKEIGKHVINNIIDPIIQEYGSNKEILAHLEQVKEHVLDHLLDFVAEAEPQHQGEEEMLLGSHVDFQRDRFRKYRVNPFIDNRDLKGAPVIIETNPTYYNLFGKIEKNVEHGMYLTDFTMIHSGSVHRANGGYLVLDAGDIFKTPSVWETLKRILKNRKGFIEDMGEQYSLLPTSGLRPQPIPLDIKVILIGNDEIYHILYEMDEEFPKIFKIKADFDFRMPRTAENISAYVSFIATRSRVEDLLHFDRSGVAAIVEHGSRLVEDQRHLTTQFGSIKDLIIEADFVARADGSKLVKRGHVEEALKLKFHRVNLYEEHIMDMIQNQNIIITVDGKRVGQVNGLAVYDMGDYAFGRINRITCTTSVTDDGIFNIDRASKLSGNIHDKGVYILSGFLNSLLSREQSLGFSASVCFEQSYGMIDGDSASVTELVAVVSALANIPILQNFAMTGSINQFGEIQPVGGINEKVEGFFKTCRMLGKDKSYSVIIPHQNVENLMLSFEAQSAIKSGFLKIFPVKHVREAFELATGHRFGIDLITDKKFVLGSALDIIHKKLQTVHDSEKEFHESHHHKKPESAPSAAKGLRMRR